MKWEREIADQLCGPFETVQINSLDAPAGALTGRGVETRAPFFDLTTWATYAYVMFHEAGAPPSPRLARGGLAPWQLRRAKEMMVAPVRPGLTLATIALACELSESHFSREFKQSTGQTPHRWALQQRVAMAKEMLADTFLPLNKIASACGFVDESHLSRWFKRLTGSSPGSWKRERAA
jgi:AraC family transcriptional regulator